jgi:hypothetical protein
LEVVKETFGFSRSMSHETSCGTVPKAGLVLKKLYVYEVDESEFVLTGWTNSIGNGLYDFYAVKMKVEPPSNSFLAGSLSYVLGGAVAIAVLSVVFLGIRFSRRRVEAHGENTRNETDSSTSMS